ncbi:MAG TPA: outer-membrane lipoprotein carrier protein LolA [Caulobacteraceae bacterium]|nr:outer-membrane lipoprotein carrier protein LolA [Caulobacteraceae bacterium]
MKTLKTGLLAFTALAAAAAAPIAASVATSASAQAAALSPADQQLVAKAQAHLQSMTSVTGRFVQTDARGAVTKGTYYLQRPGKIRFEYDKPSGLLVVADGSNVNVHDRRLKTFDRYPLGRTPLSLFLAKSIRLDQGVRVSSVARTQDGFMLTARDAKRQADGAITLVFADAQAPRLKEWIVADAQGRRTRVQLASMQNASLKSDLFVLRDPTRRTGRP